MNNDDDLKAAREYARQEVGNLPQNHHEEGEGDVLNACADSFIAGINHERKRVAEGEADGGTYVVEVFKWLSDFIESRVSPGRHAQRFMLDECMEHFKMDEVKND